MLKAMKLSTLSSLKRAGVFSLVQNSKWRRDRLLILAFHGLSLADEHSWDPSLYIQRSQFAARLRLLKQSGCVVLTLSEALQRLYAKDLPERSVAITFDDGSYDFYAIAHPLLRDFNFPATLYLTTFYSSYNRPVFDVMCSYLIWKGRGSTLDLEPLIGRKDKVVLTTVAARIATTHSLMQFAYAMRLSASDKDALLIRLANSVRVDYDSLLNQRILHIMKPAEVQALEGVDIQMHTHRHRTPIDREKFVREIEDNRSSIKDIVGTEAVHFCYPNGYSNLAFMPWLNELGVESAVTSVPGIATTRSHRLLLPRLVDTSALSSLEFEGWLSGVSNALPQRLVTRRHRGLVNG